MKNTDGPIKVGKAPTPVGYTDYTGTFDAIKAKEDEVAKSHQELPHEINNFPEILGIMVSYVDDMGATLRAVQNNPNYTDKMVDAQLEKLEKLKEMIFDLNGSVYDLKL